MLVQVFQHESVLEAAKRRISAVFDDFENICVSVSGGKDSTVLAHLVLSEGARRGRRVMIFFLDEEVDYEAEMKADYDHVEIGEDGFTTKHTM
jgi:predicted phosphoadenosine phosphosulfate sulfurtransferase